MAKVRIIAIDKDGVWFNVYEDPGADDLTDTDLSVNDVILDLTSKKSYTHWKNPESENYVIQLHS